jgi:SAM-dependent methyltransferase
MSDAKITSAIVRDDFNSIEAVLHYTRAAVSLGLWESERIFIDRFFTDRTAPLLEAGCGAGRATLGLWALGYRNITAFDFADELLEQAVSLARERGADAIRFVLADATRMESCHVLRDTSGIRAAGERGCPEFSGALFLFNGLMQIPGRENRRSALTGLHSACRPDAPLIFTTHDRDDCGEEAELWARERAAWQTGTQDPRLVEFGDRYMESTDGRIFMHLPDQAEIREDLAATGWKLEFTAMRREIARESRAVRAFSDECRFWVGRRR